MKFLCDNCKAKYQIADEKLHGRAVQMKCRKCGHMIEVPAVIPATAPAGAPEPAPPPASPAAPVAPAPAAARAPVPKPAAPKPAAPVPPHARPVRPAPAAPTGRPLAAPQKASTAAPVTPAPAAAEAAPKSAASGALAGAFAKTVKETEVTAAIEVLSAGAAEEWYVGINGVPLGPVRLSVLRQKASQGLVNEESLVWREGFDEWLPLRTFPELVVLVQEAREHSVRPVLTPAAPQAQRISSLPQPPRAAAVAPVPPAAAPVPVAPPPAAPAAHSLKDVAAAALEAKSPHAPAPVRPAPQLAPPPETARAGNVDVLADPFAVGAVAATPDVAAASGAASASAPETAAAQAHAPERHSVAPERHSVIEGIAGGVKRQVRLHPAAVAFIGLLGVLGGVLITVMLVGNKQPPVTPTVQIVTVTAPAATTPGGAPAATPTGSGIALPENAIVGDGSKSGGVRLAANKDGGTSGPPEKNPGEAAPLNVGLQDMPGMAGPNVGGATPGAGNQSLPALDQSDIQRVVSQNVGFVRRQCWEPALASRSPNAPSSAKVTVAITIGADGSVQSANASGGGGYPDLASCVASRVRGWRFPPSSGTSNASVPFVFAAQ